MGPPGAGKGTQAELLAEKFNLYYFETSKILEEEFKRGKGKYRVEGHEYSVSKEKKNWLQGKLCSPAFVTFLVQRKIKELAKANKNLILSGSPRTLYEGERILPLLEKIYGKKNIKIFFLEISPEETIFRNSHRRICELMRHSILWLEENANLKQCPLDGSKLVRREGLDDPDTIKVRLKEYKERTFPLLEYFKKRKLKVEKINGSLAPALVFEEILKKLNY